MPRSMFDRAVEFAKRHLGEDDDYQGAQNALINDSVFGPWIEADNADNDLQYEFTMSIVRRAEFELYG